MAAALFCLAGGSAWAQTWLETFDNPSDYTNDFNFTPGYAAGPTGPCYSIAGVGLNGSDGLGFVAASGSQDLSFTYKDASFDFTVATNITVSVFFQAGGSAASGGRIQVGLVGGATSGMSLDQSAWTFGSYKLNNNGGGWGALAITPQYKSAGTTGTTSPALVQTGIAIVSGNWYLYSVYFTNLGNAGTNANAYQIACSLVDYGADGATPGANLITANSVVTIPFSGSQIATNKGVFPCIRSQENWGAIYLDDFGAVGYPVPTGTAPYISAQPTNETVPAGTTASFLVAASLSDQTSTYQWLTNGVVDPTVTGQTYAITRASVPANNNETFQAIVGNANGNTPSQVATLTVANTPFILVQPASQTVTQPQTATFTISALGQEPLYYEWLSNNVPVTGWVQDGSNYTTAPTVYAQNNGDSYTVIVSNVLAHVTSSTATLTVMPIPPIIDQFNTGAASWTAPWFFSGPDNQITWDSTRDAQNNPHSGSVRCVFAMTNNNESGGAWGCVNDGWAWDANWVIYNPSGQVGTIQFDLQIDPSTAPTVNGDFGFWSVFLVQGEVKNGSVNVDNVIEIGTQNVPLSATNWTHLTYPVTANTPPWFFSYIVQLNGGGWANSVTANIDNFEVGGPAPGLTLVNPTYSPTSGLSFTITNVLGATGGSLYSTWVSTDLVNWTDQSDFLIPQGATSYLYTDPAAVSVSAQYYKVAPFKL
jgi:hypothetical protein